MDRTEGNVHSRGVERTQKNTSSTWSISRRCLFQIPDSPQFTDAVVQDLARTKLNTESKSCLLTGKGKGPLTIGNGFRRKGETNIPMSSENTNMCRIVTE